LEVSAVTLLYQFFCYPIVLWCHFEEKEKKKHI
jgi:hypothetical protein